MVEVETEEWRDIKGFEGYYKISSNGRVKSLNRKVKRRDGMIISVSEKMLKCRADEMGYPRVLLYGKNGERQARVHQLVAENFLAETYSNGMIVNHIDGTRENNKVNNLEFCTYQENTRHAFNIGLCKTRGLTEIEVGAIEILFHTCMLSQTKIASLFNVTKQTISRILSCKSYASMRRIFPKIEHREWLRRKRCADVITRHRARRRVCLHR